MAVVPVSGTNIRFLTGVPFNADYKDTRWFDSLSEQTAYFLAKPVAHSMSQANFTRIEGRPYIKANVSIDSLLNVNYLMFQNAQYINKWFYAFVTKLEYISKEVTYVHFQLDVLQTWRFEMNFKESFVEREHCKLFDSNGRPIVNTIDEGLYYGSEYENVHVENFIPFTDVFFLVICCKQPMHGGSVQKVTPINNGIPQPLTYYIHPFKRNGTSPNTMVGSLGVALSSIKDVLEALYSNEQAQNNIVSLYVTEFFGRNMIYEDNLMTFPSAEFEAVSVFNTENELDFNTLYCKSLNFYDFRTKDYGDKYTGFFTSSESKLYMYPYAFTVITDFQGNQIEIKNEFIKSANLILEARGSLGHSNKTSVNVEKYKTGNNLSVTGQRYARSDHALINNNPNDVPIITDLLSAYMQGNRNSIVNQQNQVMFNGVMGSIAGMLPTLDGQKGNGIGVVNSAGNAMLQMQALQAKRDDLRNVPPSIQKMGNNTAFDYGNAQSGVFIIKKQITSEYRQKLEDFFKLYGYKVQRVKIPNFHTRSRFNYVKTIGCTITGNFANEDKVELCNIFDNGITLWHNDNIGSYSTENEVIT